MAKKTFQFLSPADWIVMEIWQVNREKNSTFYYKKLPSHHTLSSKSSMFSESGIYSSIDLNCFSSNANATAITVILKIFTLDNKDRKREEFLLINTMSAYSEQIGSWIRSRLFTLKVPTVCYDFMLLVLIRTGLSHDVITSFSRSVYDCTATG